MPRYLFSWQDGGGVNSTQGPPKRSTKATNLRELQRGRGKREVKRHQPVMLSNVLVKGD